MVYRRIDSATDEWTDGDVSHEAIVFRLTNEEVNQGIYAHNNVEVEPQYYEKKTNNAIVEMAEKNT